MAGTDLGVASSAAGARRLAAGALQCTEHEIFLVGGSITLEPERNDEASWTLVCCSDTTVTAVASEEESAGILRRLVDEGKVVVADGTAARVTLLRAEGEDELEDLPSSLGRMYPDLAFIHVEDCPLWRLLPTTFWMLQRLQVLHVERTNVRTLPDDLCRCCLLEELSVACNELRALPRVLPVSLRKIDASGNRLRAFRIAARGDLPRLEELLLADNVALSDVTLGQRAASRLELLDFSGTALHQWTPPVALPLAKDIKLQCRPGPTVWESAPATAGRRLCWTLGSPHLKVLSLWNCQIQCFSLPEGHQQRCSPLLLLEELVVCGSRSLRSIPDSLVQSSVLEVIQLRDNDLRSLPSGLVKASSLRKLDVRGNRNLRTLPSRLGHLKELRSLLVKGCNLEHLPPRCSRLCDSRF